MPDVTEAHIFNAARAAGKLANGSEALRSTTVCVAELDDGTLVVGLHTQPAGADDDVSALALQAALATVPAAPAP